jgi:hypothetical protein
MPLEPAPFAVVEPQPAMLVTVTIHSELNFRDTRERLLIFGYHQDLTRRYSDERRGRYHVTCGTATTGLNSARDWGATRERARCAKGAPEGNSARRAATKQPRLPGCVTRRAKSREGC